MSEVSGPVRLHEDHFLDRFDCGKESLNRFLRLHALANQKARISNTFVVESERAVAGYYTLALVSIGLDEAPKSHVRGLPAYPVLCVLMARFAVDSGFQGKGLGRSLFVDALRRAWSVMEDGPAPARLFVVDAKDEDALRFYQHFGMVSSPIIPNRLFLSYKVVQSLFPDEYG